MLKSLSLWELLRYGFSGAIFIVALLSAQFGVTNALASKSWPDVVLIATAALVAGCFFYSIHRILYRFITRIIQARLAKKHPIEKLPATTKFLEREYTRDFERWKRRCTSATFQSHLDVWAAHVHFLYCSAWAAVAGVVVGRVLLLRTILPRPLLTDSRALLSTSGLLVFALICLLSAIVQDRVLTYYDRRLVTDADLLPKDSSKDEDED